MGNDTADQHSTADEAAADSAEAEQRSVEGRQRIRQSRRRPLRDVLVAIDAPGVADAHWVVDALDISALGIGLVLPPELSPGTKVQLSFKLDENAEFSQVPATVRHRNGLAGGVGFDEWGEEDRLRLLEYLVRFYEDNEE